MLKPKKLGVGLEIKTFAGQSKRTYLVFRTHRGEYHTFQEVEAKTAARDCGAKEPTGNENTQTMWKQIW